LISPLFFAFLMKTNPTVFGTNNKTFVELILQAMTLNWLALDALCWVIFFTIGIHLDRTRSHERFCQTLLMELDDKFNKANIVIHPELSPYEITHITALEKLIVCPSGMGPQSRLICMDATHPAYWWTNNMLGYLAVQSRWARDVSREIVRIFMWNKQQIQSTAGCKLLTLHRLLGCTTIVCPPRRFRMLVRPQSLQREFVVWDDDHAQPTADCWVDYGQDGDICGFESHWDCFTGEEERKRFMIDMRLKGEASGRGSLIYFKGIGRDRAKELRDAAVRIIGDSHTDPTQARTLVVDAMAASTIHRTLQVFGDSLKS
jgi:hypothetical protein